MVAYHQWGSDFEWRWDDMRYHRVWGYKDMGWWFGRFTPCEMMEGCFELY